MQSADPCVECGGIALKLIDGYYYCVECNTQNTNVRETVMEEKALRDGTFALGARRKVVKIQENAIEMSREWYKWHAYNFVILGLADELVAIGAKPSFKTKLLWIWTRYIKKYQNKDALGFEKKNDGGNNDNIALSSFMGEKNSISDAVPDVEENEVRAKKFKNVIKDGSKRDIKFLTKGVIIAMLYLALNLDESDIQLYHIFRFMKEKRLNFSNIQRFLPEDIHVKSIQDEWQTLIHSTERNMFRVRSLAMSLLRKLDLGTPKVPDMRKIVDDFLLELCLPNDMKPLVYSLMFFHRCDFLDMSSKSKEHLVHTPDYEGVAMAYVLVALKMCFGLDGDYEEKLSDAVEKINDERNLSKSYRMGKYSEPSTRLFSFREWCSYIQFRKITLCKSSLHMAELHRLDIDDYVYLEHMNDRPQNNKDLRDETAINLINKIPEDNEGRVIPKHMFFPTLTPMYDYTEIIIEHNQDQEIRALLSEDFTQYSLNYACEYFELIDTNAENIIKGVSEDRKTVSNVILGTLVTKKTKTEMVFVKNCENRNWLITNPPRQEHVTCEDVQNVSNDKESDHGYDSENPLSDKEVSRDTENVDEIDQQIKQDNRVIDSENQANEKEVPKESENVDDTHQSMSEDCREVNDSENPANEKVSEETENVVEITDQAIKKDKKVFTITEEDNDKNIFDDSFEELDLKDEMEQNNGEELYDNNEDQPLQHNNFLNDDRASISDVTDDESVFAPFNPDTFDREQTIKELILGACKKYKCPVPPEYKTPKERKPRKRKAEETTKEPRKRAKVNSFEARKKVDELISSYYNLKQFDEISRMQEAVSLAIRNNQSDSVLNVSNTNQNGTANLANEKQGSDASSRRSSISTENIENQSNVNPQINLLEQSENDQNLDETDDIEEINEHWESKIFEGEEEMKLDDLVPKGDPKFDEEKYDVNQLYIKIKLEEDKMSSLFSLHDNPKLEQILNRKIEQCKNSTEFDKLKVKPLVKMNYESDSEDEIPLTVLREEKKLIEEKIAWEDNFEPLINKENVSEFKFWFRHYDETFMIKSFDSHKKFDEELKENTPGSFYFVIRECSAIMNCSNFSLYKHLQILEKYIIASLHQ